MSRTDPSVARFSWLELAALAAALVAPLLVPWAAAAVLAAALTAWLWSRPPRREAWIVVPALTLALLATLGGLGQAQLATGDAAWRQEATRRYELLWVELAGQARQASAVLTELRGPAEQPPESFDLAARGDADLAAFERLDRLAGPTGGTTALFWVDEDGTPTAWAGTGLLLELEPRSLPERGPAFVAGFSAVSLVFVEPLDPQLARSSRALAGRSLPVDRLPFAPPGGEPATAFRWSLVAPAATPTAAPGTASEGATAAAGLIRLQPAGWPEMWIEQTAQVASADAGRWRQRGWALIGFALLALAVMRTVGMLLAPGRRRYPWPGAVLQAVGGVSAWAVAAGVGRLTLAAVVVAALLAGAGLRALLRRRPLRPAWLLPADRRWAAALGGGAMLLLVAASWAFQRLWLERHGAVVDLGAELLGGAEQVALRLAGFGVALGLLSLVALRSRRPPAAGGGDRWCWSAVGLALLAAATVAVPVLPVLLLAAAGAAASGWLFGRTATPRLGALWALALVCALLSGVAWEVGQREALRRQVSEQLSARMGPPGPPEAAALAAATRDFFERLDLNRFAPRPTAGMEYQDLALAIWTASPLARVNARSALVITPLDRSAASASAFSTGVALPEDFDFSKLETGMEGRVPAWRAARVEDSVEITADHRPWGTAAWWLQPLPGFRLGQTAEADEILAALLRGQAVGEAEPAQLPRSVLYALYDLRGTPRVSPWEEAPPAPGVASGAGGGASGGAVAPGSPQVTRVDTPTGLAWAFSRLEADGYEVLFLPLLRPGLALLRLAIFATGVLVPLAVVTLLALLLALPRAAFRELLRRTVRSYSKRLALVYGALLLIPLLLLNLALLRGVERSLLRDRRDRGEQALRAAQRVIQDRLSGPESGFEVATALAAEMRRLPRLIDHEVNLYFEGDVFTSSRKELFTAGLLPRRIPGDVFARLEQLPYGVASRLNDAFQPPFLELYAAVLPDEGGPNLVVSVPLQAQQEEDAEVLAGLRAQALAYTTALVVLLLAVGSRLARNFTGPIRDLVAGTRRIAAGATSLELAPSDLELAALVEAVDDMARRIADGREQLLREKALVEGMIENITPAVVSLDAEHRVLMHNRAASALLGVEVGDDLLALTRGQERLAPVAALLAGEAAAGRPRLAAAGADPAQPGGQPSRTTLQLAADGGGERKEWTVVCVPLPAPGPPGSLLVVEDVTEMLQGQRLAAWAEMARIIAHEIKNPLTPVRLSAEHMRQVYHSDREHFSAVFERCTDNILRQVDELQQIASEFSTYAHIPRIDRAPGDLRAAMERLIESYRAAPPPGIEVLFEAPAEPLPAQFDERLLSRAVRNLLENAVRASGKGGVVALRLDRRDDADGGGEARIRVEDTGPGVAPELVGRIFDPYFSTHDTGTGLGLPIARRIAEEHGGGISARNRQEGGLTVEIAIPLLRKGVPPAGTPPQPEENA